MRPPGGQTRSGAAGTGCSGLRGDNGTERPGKISCGKEFWLFGGRQDTAKTWEFKRIEQKLKGTCGCCIALVVVVVVVMFVTLRCGCDCGCVVAFRPCAWSTLDQQLKGKLTCVCHVPHSVFEGPDDGVQHQLELLGRDREEGGETVGVYCLGG